MARRKRGKIDVGAFGWRPRVLRDGVVAGTLALVVCLFAGAGILDRYIREGGFPQLAAVIAAVLVDLANTDRVDKGLAQFTVQPKLVAAAEAKANDMAEKAYFSHTTPEGNDSWHWFREVGYDYAYAGENLAVNFSESDDVEEAWMASPTHRDNVLNTEYTEIGIAVAYGTYKGQPAIFAVQMFGRPSAGELRKRSEGVVAAAAVVQPPSVVAEGPERATLGETTAGVVSAEDIPWWAKLLAQPKEMLRVSYYIVGLLVIAGLFFDFELEMKWHHLRHARKAGMLLATMSMLFIAADWLFFGEPVLAAIVGVG